MEEESEEEEEEEEDEAIPLAACTSRRRWVVARRQPWWWAGKVAPQEDAKQVTRRVAHRITSCEVCNGDDAREKKKIP